MKKNLLYIYSFWLGCTCVTFAQKTQDELFESKAKQIKNEILNITTTEKNALKQSIDSINTLLIKEEVTYKQADVLKEVEAQKRAKNIEEKVNKQNQKLSNLVHTRVDGKITPYEDGIFISADGVFIREEGKIINKRKSRTNFDILIAFGHNNLITDSDFPNYDGHFGNGFFEWGASFKTKLKKDSNLWNLRYGISFVHSGISPKNNYYFVQNGHQTNLEKAPMNLRKSKFNNTYITIPVHLELNFGRNDNYKVAIGGFVGYNLYSSQNLKYTENGRRIKDMTNKDWNVNDFQYGTSVYFGYKIISLYVKYDLNPLFRNNTIDQHNISVGIRLDM